MSQLAKLILLLETLGVEHHLFTADNGILQGVAVEVMETSTDDIACSFFFTSTGNFYEVIG